MLLQCRLQSTPYYVCLQLEFLDMVFNLLVHLFKVSFILLLQMCFFFMQLSQFHRCYNECVINIRDIVINSHLSVSTN